jgi:hypothetical protein
MMLFKGSWNERSVIRKKEKKTETERQGRTLKKMVAALAALKLLFVALVLLLACPSDDARVIKQYGQETVKRGLFEGVNFGKLPRGPTNPPSGPSHKTHSPPPLARMG